jgi:hypothetical protein
MMIAAALAAPLLCVAPALAHEGDDHAQKAETAVQTLPTAEGLAALAAGIANIEALAAAGKDGIHDEIEKLEKGPIAALLTDPTVPPERKTRLAASLTQLTAQLAKVHDAADNKDAAQAGAAAKKAAAALRLVQSAVQ